MAEHVNSAYEVFWEWAFPGLWKNVVSIRRCSGAGGVSGSQAPLYQLQRKCFGQRKQLLNASATWNTCSWQRTLSLGLRRRNYFNR
ncbi:hypothetical protein NPIL_24631 [Nephila pilipes]|uniref:Uncharacterized protein n=1 Tax=Nephila pilipes TaxID=299642 RepID=A0A8X6UN58_NEPPI|nr:hypothetical protein NPIL_24631 [Nephila pilipes]